MVTREGGGDVSVFWFTKGTVKYGTTHYGVPGF